MSSRVPPAAFDGIAIIGMQGRFPGAPTVDQFWANLKAGVESISRLTEEQLIESGVPESSLASPRYVRAKGLLDRIDQFDASFFGILPKDAAVMDPQQRLFLECAWEALERAGYDPATYAGPIGVYAGAYLDTYLLANLCSRPSELAKLVQSIQVGTLQTELGNDKDYLATRVSFKLNLRGPSMTVQSACSTSLVAITQACQSLVTYQCDMALAGGVTVTVPQAKGYDYQEDGMLSPDGHCRPFDARAQGTVFSNGLGVVVLKRLADAVADGDDVIAVIRGWALNNDGASKLSYTAPSVDGQADVIAMAHAMAGVDARSISYVEAHGTATPLGDPIEIAALTQAFRLTTEDTRFCAVGSLKSNIGHLDVASGVAALMKTALSLRHRTLPPTLHYSTPNPQIDFERSPFYVNDTLRPWPDASLPRRAGVSSFGVGGTNAHVILEEAPEVAHVPATRQSQVLVISARSATALDRAAAALATRLSAGDAPPLADVAYTLQVGRRAFSHRRVVVCSSHEEAVAALAPSGSAPVSVVSHRQRGVVFMFPGQGSQSPGMGRALYETEPVFRDAVDRCAGLLRPGLGLDLRTLLYPSPSTEESAAREIRQTVMAQPAIFTTSYTLAQLWMSWGIEPGAFIGHSVGELVAACLAGVMTLPDALTLLAARGRMMQAVEPGAMLAVRLPADAAMAIAGADLDLAASNSPNASVLAGTGDAVLALEQELTRRGIGFARLATSHAFHSRMMDEVVAPFELIARELAFSVPRIPIASTVTGTWLSDDEARRPSYWSQHLRQPVRFAEAVATLGTDRVLIEVGPGQALTTLARQTLGPAAAIVSSLDHAASRQDDVQSMQAAVGRVWMNGADVRWTSLHAETRRRVALPTYPFERQRFWIEPDRSAHTLPSPSPTLDVPGDSQNTVGVTAAVTETPVESSVESSRDGQVVTQLKSVMSSLSGIGASDLDSSTPFLDLGFDSLLLTQVSAACQREFGVKVTMRQLLADLPTIGQLSSFLQSKLDATGLRPAASSQVPIAPPTADRPVVPAAVVPGFKPPDRAAATLSDVQERHLAELISRYTKRTATSKQMTAKYRPVLADPRTVSGFNRAWKEMVYPIVVNRSSGARLWDVDGNEYIDLLNGFGPNFLGHSPSVVVEAMKTQLDCGLEVGPQTPLAGEVAELISEMTGMDRVSFVNTGSEAVQAAMRLARTVTGRDRVVLFAKDYHGNFDEVLVRGNLVDGHARSMPIAPGIPQRAVADMVVLEYGSPEALDYISRNGDTIAAVLIEPIQSRRPEFQPRAFIHEVRRLTEQSGTVMIMDEVITGFRLGPGGAQAYYGVRADLATYGKVVGGGMPIGVVAGRADLMDTFDGGQWNYGDDSFPEKGVTFFAGTFVRHPLAMAAARATLKFLKAQPRELWDTVHRRTRRLAESVNAMLGEHGVPIELAHFGSQMFVRVRDDAKLANLVFYHLRARGVFLAEGFPTYLTIAHSEDDIDTIIDAWRQSIAAMQKGGFFPEARPRPVADRTVVELTAAQREIWLAIQMNPAGAVAFNEATTIRLSGELDAELLRSACREVVARHDALGATVSADGERLHISGPLSLAVPVVDLTTSANADAALDGLIEAEASTPFDLERGPLVRATLVALSPGEHVLLLTAHHIVCDGWSFNVLVAELSETYSSGRRGTRADLMPPVSFAGYARELKRRVGSADDALVEKYWRERLADPPAALDLPTDGPRPPVRDGAGSTARRVIPQALANDVRALARRHGCTLFSTLFAAYQVLLHRLSGQLDFCVGVPVASQSDPQLHGLVGYAVNFLPFRATLATNESFATCMCRVRDEVADGLAHQPFTYGQLLPALALPRSPGRLPLVEVEFNLERMDRYDEFDGLTSTFKAVTKRAANFDLFLNVVDTNEGFLLECDHATEIFGSATVERWLASYEQLLQSAVADANGAIGALDILSPAERHQTLVAFNQTAADFPHATTLHGLFEEQSDRTPDAIAVVDVAGACSYRDLDSRANRVAHHLLAEGTQPGDLIAVAVEPGVDMLTTLLAVLKCGAAYVPIDLTHPASRVDHILRNAGPRLLVDDQWLRGRANESADRGPACGARPGISVAPSARAYVMHTSGTTGTPKGVEVEHRSVVNLLWSMRRSIGMTAEDRLLAITTLTFDIAALELFLPLISGATVVFTRREVARDGHQLAAELLAAGITVLQATPSTWRMLVDAGWPGDPSLRMLCGGETLPADLAKRLRPRGRTLWNVYGPTETTIWSSCGEVVAGAPVTLGRPIANTQLYVLDADRNPLPIGVPGHLHIGGTGLARGYLNDAELTRSRFVRNPFDAGTLLYATGDLVRHTAEGSLEFLGRIDDQVKVRGHRVELAEIELALAEHPAIAAAAATTELVDGTRRIVAGIVARTLAPSLDEVHAFLEQRLPSYMWPSRIGFVDALPLTPSAKVDRRRLLDVVSTVSRRRQVAVAARDETERALTRICAEALRIDTVSVFDDVFELGADSLTVFQISAKARQDGMPVSPTDILLHRNVAALAAMLTSTVSPSDGGRSDEQVMVRLSDGPEASPMFLVHGVSGEVVSYEPLARAMSARRPVFGFRAPLESLADRPSLERLAARYVAEMRRERPNGPFHIGGFCAGGLLAFEMAQQLQAANEPVGVVAMLDCELDATDRPNASTLETIAGCLRNVPKWIADDASIYGWRHLIGRLRSNSRRIARRVFGPDTALTAAALQDELGLWNLSDSELEVVVELNRAIEAYRPRPYQGRVLLVRPRANPLLDGVHAPSLGWTGYAADVDEVVVAGSHSTMLAAAFAAELATTIEARIARADAEYEARTVTPGAVAMPPQLRSKTAYSQSDAQLVAR